MPRPTLIRYSLLWLAGLLLAACAPATPAVPMPLVDDQPTFLYFYTDN